MLRYGTVYLFVIVISILFASAVYFYSQKITPITDTQYSAILANNLITGKGYELAGWPELIYPPGISFLLIPFLLLSIQLSVATIILYSVSYSLLFVVLYLLVSKYFGAVVGFFTAAFFLLNGNMLFFGLQGMVEPVWMLLLLSSYYISETNYKYRYIFAGISLGFAYLVKPETILFFLIWLVLTTYTKKRKIIKYVPAMVIFSIFVFSYSGWIFTRTGKITFSGKTATIYWDAFIENDQIQQYDLAYRLNSDKSVGTTIKDAPPVQIDLIARFRNNVPAFKQSLFELLLPIKFTIFALVCALLKLRKMIDGLLKLGIFLSPLALVLFLHLENRYLNPVLLYSIFILVLGFSVKNKGVFDRLIAVLCLTVLMYLTYFSYWPLKTEYRNMLNEKGKTVSIIEHIPPADLIISVKPLYSYYLEKDFYRIPRYVDGDDLAGFFDHYSDYIVVLDDWCKNTSAKSDHNIRKEENLGLIKISESNDAEINFAIFAPTKK